MRKFSVHDLTTGMIGPPSLIACGISAIVGVFLTWVIVPLYDDLVLPIAGWRLIIWSRSLGETFPEPYLVLAGGGLMALCGAIMTIGMIPAVKARLGDTLIKRVRSVFTVGACAGALAAVIGAIWFIPHILGLGEEGTLGVGFYLAILAAALGLVFALALLPGFWQSGLKGIKTLYKMIIGDYNSAP